MRVLGDVRTGKGAEEGGGTLACVTVERLFYFDDVCIRRKKPHVDTPRVVAVWSVLWKVCKLQNTKKKKILTEFTQR